MPVRAGRHHLRQPGLHLLAVHLRAGLLLRHRLIRPATTWITTLAAFLRRNR